MKTISFWSGYKWRKLSGNRKKRKILKARFVKKDYKTGKKKGWW